MKKRISKILPFIFLLFWSLMVNGQTNIAEGFFDQEVSSGYTLPVGIVFDDNGNGYVWEKGGKIFSLDPVTFERQMILDLSEEVGSWGDHGLMSVVLDPDFQENGHIYTAYVVDRYYLFNFGRPEYNPDSSIIKNATIGRVSRFSFDLNAKPIQLKEDSRKVILGEDISDGFPILADFHGIGSLGFGNDESLFVSCGDGGLDSEPNIDYYTSQAIEDGIIDSTLVLGAYRSQYLGSMNGKILRLDKNTGEGLEGNPFYNHDNPRSTPSRVWALGLRNPYKFTYLPGTGGHNPNLGNPGKLVIGDVGSSYWEEFNLAERGGLNFGWPIYEGHHAVWPYGYYEIEHPFAPNPAYDGTTCARKNFIFTDFIKQDQLGGDRSFYNPCENSNDVIPEDYPTYFQTRPFLYYNNIQWNQPVRSFVPRYDQDGKAIEVTTDSIGLSEAIEGYSAIPGPWYERGSLPDSFNNSLIVSDFSGWIKAFEFDESFALKKVRNIRSDIKGVVNVSHNQIDDCFYYVHILSGEIRKICYGGNPPPVAIAHADTTFGGNTLMVNFDATESYDPNMLPIAVQWDFSDGTTSDKMQVAHTFQAGTSTPVKFPVYLTVRDSMGAEATDSIIISLNNSPPNVKITSPTHGSFYSINGYNRLDFEAETEDKEEQDKTLQFKWQLHLHHNLHFHSEEPIFSQTHETNIEPVGCGERDEFWYRISLEVTDSYGLSGKDEVIIKPNCNKAYQVNWLRTTETENGLKLNWKVVTTVPIAQIMVQRIGELGKISDLGLATEDSFVDLAPLNGANRYRLKIYTNDHQYFYSEELSIDFPLKNALTIYPNPNNTSFLNVHLSQHLNKQINIEVYDMVGQMVVQRTFAEPSGNDFLGKLNIIHLTPGIYMVKVENDQRVFHERLEVIK